MTKLQANEIKKVLHGDYVVYFQSKTGKLRVRAYTFYDDFDKEFEQKRIAELLNKVSASGFRPKFSIEHKTYQGFIHFTNILFQ
jgi:hypothetical protein